MKKEILEYGTGMELKVRKKAKMILRFYICGATNNNIKGNK